ncbi:protein SON [Drosophila mauritiana]|uniref:Protein SON n=1 Tax=Drosophila mauritiana TaxID=7226 RepID=A0A6P8K8N1_DROMA|nr:protein SON [Drosophila mauritiana]
MTENTEKGASVETPQLAGSQPNPPDQEPLPLTEIPPIKVKSERPDAEVEAKLRAMNAKIKAEMVTLMRRSNSNELVNRDESGDSESSASVDDKKDIKPVKSSNEILAELFGVFNAAPPEELLDNNLFKKKKKVKKEKKDKKDKKAKKKKTTKSDGECSDSEAEGKHKHKRKKHKHKDGRVKDKEKERDRDRDKSKEKDRDREKSKEKDRDRDKSKEKDRDRVADKSKEKDRDRDKDRDKSKDKLTAAQAPSEKEKEKSGSRKRSAVEPSSHSEKRERHEREKHRDWERERERENERERESVRSHNSFYNGHREADRSKGSESASTKSRQEHDLSDISLSDEESYLREKASNGRRRAHNSFYDGKEEPSVSPRRNVRESNTRRNRKSRSRSRDLGIDKKRLLEIARRNAINMFKRGTMPGVANMTAEVKDKVLVKMRYGGRTIQDLTDFCKKISNGDGLSDLSSEEESDVDKNGNAKAFHHPFQLKEREPIVMHIRNSTALVPAPPRLDEQTKAITMQFPVSSGQTHRNNEVWVPVDPKDSLVPLPSLPPAKQATNMFKETPKNVFAKSIPLQEQQEPAFKPLGGAVVVPPLAATQLSTVPQPVPLTVPKELVPPAVPFVPEVPIPSTSPVAPTQSPSIFPDVMPPSMDVSSIITQRLSAIRRLQENPADSEALKMMYTAHRNMSSWANSKHLPGQFTGSTGAQVMKAHELNSGPQLWVRKDQMTSTKPVTGGMGMALLQKMGWKPGEGLGRCKTGSLQPLLLDVKLDKRGLVSRDDLRPPQTRAPAAQRRNKNMAGPIGAGPCPAVQGAGPGPVTPTPLVTQDKHPVCVLNELTSKNKWMPPQYKLREDIGPAYNRSFLFSVEVNGQTFTPDRGCNNKKEAKLNAAALCLRALGILPPS